MLAVVLAVACHRSERPTVPTGGETLANPESSIRGGYTMPGDGVAHTFRELLATAPGSAASEEACLLVQDATGLRLATALAPATQSPPEVLDDFDHLLRASPGPARVLTPYGRLGAASGTGPVLVTLTDVPASHLQRAAIAGLLNVQGLLDLRRVEMVGGGLETKGEAPSRTALPAPFSQAQLLSASGFGKRPETAVTLFLAVAAETPSEMLRSVLVQVPESWEVVLCAPLPGDTRLPPEPEPMPSETCQQWPLPLGGAAEGEMPRETLVQGLAPLSMAVEQCMTSAQSADSGRIEIGLRIVGVEARRASVGSACLLSDTVQNSNLTHCILQAARNLHWPALSTPGVIDVALPVRLAPPQAARRKPLCAR